MNVQTTNRRFPKRRLAIAGALVAALAGAALALPVIIDVNKYRGLIQSKAEESLGRKVTLGPMSLSLLPTFGVKVDDLEVEHLLRARSLTVGVRLLPLVFGGAVDVRKLVLIQPEITAERGGDGRWSFEGLGGGASAPPGSGGSAASGGQPGRPFSLARLVITGGVVHLRDAARRSGGTLALDFGLDLDASVRGSGAGDLKTTFDGALKSERLLFELHGSLDRAAPPGTTRFDIIVDRADIDIARARDLMTAFGQSWPVPEGLLRSRSLRMGGRLQGSVSGGALSTLALTDLVVQEADIYLARDRRGRWNFDTLMAANKPPGPGSAAPTGTALTIRNMRLGGGKIALHDEAMGGTDPVDLTLKDLLLVVEEFDRDRPLGVQFHANIEPKAGSIELNGRIPLSPTGSIEATVDLSGLEARAVAPYLRSVTDIDARSGAVAAHIKMMGSYPRQVTATGSLSLDEVTTSAGRPITVKADFDLTANDSFAKVQIGRLDIKFRRSLIGLRGSMARAENATLVDLDLPSCSIDALDLMSLAALAGVRSPIEISSSQPVKIQARVRGDIARRQSLDLTGRLEVSDLAFRLPIMDKPMEQVRGRLTLRGNGFDVSGFSGVIGRSDIAGTMSVTDLGSPRASFSLASRHADFWELMSFLKEAPSGAGATGSAGGPAPADDLSSGVTAHGTLAIGDGSFDTLAFTDLSSTVVLERKVLELDPVSMKLYGGSMSGSATMDMNRIPALYTVRSKASGIDTDALLAGNLQMKGMLSGALSGQFSVMSSGATREAALRNARGSGSVRIENGKIGAVNVLRVLSRVSDLLGERSLKEVSARLAKEGTEFSTLNATLAVDGGRITSHDLSMTSPDLELEDDGSLDMLAGTIDIAGQIIFSEALSQAMVQERSKAVDYFWDTKRGRVDLPLTMSGPITSPTPNIDWGSAGGRLARRKVESSVRDRLNDAGLGGLLGDRGGRLPERRPEPTAPKAPSSAPPASGDLAVTIEEKAFSGNALLPDLKIRGTLGGTNITRANVRVMDQHGRVVHEQSLMEKVNKYYTTHDRAAPAAINFRVEVDGRRLLGSRGDLQVTITVGDAKGASTTTDIQVSR